MTPSARQRQCATVQTSTAKPTKRVGRTCSAQIQFDAQETSDSLMQEKQQQGREVLLTGGFIYRQRTVPKL